MKSGFTAALLAITLTLGCSGVAEAQAPNLAQANAVDPFDAAVAAYNRNDYATAVSLFRSLAAQGDVMAQYNLGLMYDNGTGVAQDYKEAVRLYGLAAAQGLAKAQSNLGVMYANGQGVAQDYKEAVRLYGLAAAQGNAKAQFNLGVKYDNGQGVAQDYKEAARLYGLAAAQGNAGAQSNLGVMYSNGQGVAQDYVRAHMWYNLGASSLSGEEGKIATSNRDNIAKMMTPQQIAEAQAMARKCQASNFKKCD